MYNPEFAALRSIDRGRERRVELSPTLEQAHAYAERHILTNPDYVIQEDSFEGVYEPGAIARDIELADRLARKFEERMTPAERNTKKVADTFEAIVLMQTEMGNWLGENASTLKTSRFDDYTNKVDMLAEWSSPEEGTRALALAVDVTFGAGAVQKKMEAIRHEIDAGKLGMMRYFEDQRGNLKGSRFNLARTVVGVSQPVIEELAGLWMRKDTKALAAHPVQKAILTEIGFQLHYMQQYAERLKRYEIAHAYTEPLASIKKVLLEKKGIELGALAEDPVRKEIIDQTKRQFA